MMPSLYSYSSWSATMVIGSLERAPENPSNPDVGRSCAGRSAGFSVAGSAATRAGASASTATSSRAGRMSQHRVHVAQEPNPAGRDVDLEPQAAHVERLAVDRHRSRRGDAILRVVVSRFVRADL